MPSSNFKLFDENKLNMLADEAYDVSTQRLNGVQQGIASSELQNKSLYQVSLMAYALTQLMQANGYDANDSDAVSTFVNNLSSSIIQKVADRATSSDVTTPTAISKYIPPSLFASFFAANGFTKTQSLSSATASLIDSSSPPSNPDAAFSKLVNAINTNVEIVTYAGAYTNNISISAASGSGASYRYGYSSVLTLPATFKKKPKFVMLLGRKSSTSSAYAPSNYNNIVYGLSMNAPEADVGTNITTTVYSTASNYAGTSFIPFTTAPTGVSAHTWWDNSAKGFKIRLMSNQTSVQSFDPQYINNNSVYTYYLLVFY